MLLLSVGKESVRRVRVCGYGVFRYARDSTSCVFEGATLAIVNKIEYCIIFLTGGRLGRSKALHALRPDLHSTTRNSIV